MTIWRVIGQVRNDADDWEDATRFVGASDRITAEAIALNRWHDWKTVKNTPDITIGPERPGALYSEHGTIDSEFPWGPVLRHHDIEGLDRIVEYVRDCTHLSNPDMTGSGHGEVRWGVGGSSFLSLNAGILHAVAKAETGELNESRHFTVFAERMLRMTGEQQ